MGCSPWGHEGSDTTERLHFHFSLSCIGEGNGNPLQCSCLENPRDGGAWWAAIYGAAQSQTWLKRLSSSSSRHQIGKQWKQWETWFSWAPKSLQMVDCSNEIKTLAPWKKSCDQPRQHIKKQRRYFADKDPSNQSYGFSSSYVQMLELDHKKGWAPKNWWFWTVVLEKTLESPLDCKEIKPVNLKGNQSWIFIERTMLLEYFSHLMQRTTHVKRLWCC